MDRLNTYALIAALRGLDAKPDTTVGMSRKQNDKWTALLSIEKQEMYPRLDEEPKPATPATAPAAPRVSYVRQVNNRIDQAMQRQPIIRN